MGNQRRAQAGSRSSRMARKGSKVKSSPGQFDSFPDEPSLGATDRSMIDDGLRVCLAGGLATDSREIFAFLKSRSNTSKALSLAMKDDP